MRTVLYVLFVLLGLTRGQAQGCDPQINNFSFAVASCLEGTNTTLTVTWTMGGGNPACIAPAFSFNIQINLPASGIYGVNSVADVVTPSMFNWTLTDPYTLTGTNNVAIPWFTTDDIEITVRPLIVNSCALIASNSNIQILPSFLGGSPGSFSNNTANDVLSDDLGVLNLVLPVKYSSFSVSSEKCSGLLLNWSTASEINNSHFEVEASRNGTNFVAIGKVKGDNINSGSSYKFFDTNKYNDGQAVMYRLKQIDLDGTYSYSNVVSGRYICEKKISLTVAPNPAREEVRAEFLGAEIQEVTAVIYDGNGSVVKDVTLNTGLVNKVNIQNLATGIYTLQVQVGDQVFNERFIKID